VDIQAETKTDNIELVNLQVDSHVDVIFSNVETAGAVFTNEEPIIYDVVTFSNLTQGYTSPAEIHEQNEKVQSYYLVKYKDRSNTYKQPLLQIDPGLLNPLIC
jgi:hypothetical protein